MNGTARDVMFFVFHSYYGSVPARSYPCACALLDSLATPDARFRAPHWKANWQRGYSLKQLQLIALLARKHRLPFDASDFRINLRLPGVMDQMLALPWWQYRELRGALYPEWRKEFDQHFRNRFCRGAQRARPASLPTEGRRRDE